MWPSLRLVLCAIGAATVAQSYRVRMTDTDDFREVCTGMYGGSKAYIEVDFDKSTSVGQIALVMYEWADSQYLGIETPVPESEAGYYKPKTYICTTSAVESGLCTDEHRGEFITSYPEGHNSDSSSIYTTAVRFGGSNSDVPTPTTPEPEEQKVDRRDIEVREGDDHSVASGAKRVSQDTTDGDGDGNVDVDGDTVDDPVPFNPDADGDTVIPTTGSTQQASDNEPVTSVPDNAHIYTDPIRYEVPKTGYYCVGVVPITLVNRRSEGSALESRQSSVHANFSAIVEFRNQFKGELPAAEYPKIGLYGGLSIVYLALAVGWGVLCSKHYRELLPMQYYISGTIAFLLIEMLAQFAYYRFVNKHGPGSASTAFLIVISILNAARNSLSFFLLLIVSMGLSVVTPSLGDIMNRVRILTALHFVFGMSYAIGTVKVEVDSAALPIVLLLIFPLAFTLTAFLMWIIISLNGTILLLQARKQHYKMQMFQKLWRILVLSVVAVAAFFVISSISISNRMDEDFAPRSWRYRWVLLDASLAVIYLAAFSAIAWIWRPTENTVRFAMSQELAQDEADAEDYEIDALEQHHPEGLSLEPVSSRDHLHGEIMFDADENKRLFPEGSSGRGVRGGELQDDHNVFAMGDDSDVSDDEHQGLTAGASRGTDSASGSRRNSSGIGRYRDSGDEREREREPKSKAD